MKRLLIGGLLLMAVVGVQAQNVQLHYDLGRNIYPDEEAGRPKVTMTLEQFKLDSWGSWFYFVDVDFSRKFTESAYTEISRELNLYKGSKFAAHVEYNGGLSKSGSFQQAALVGMAYNGWNPALSASYSLSGISRVSSTCGAERRLTITDSWCSLPNRNFGTMPPLI